MKNESKETSLDETPLPDAARVYLYEHNIRSVTQLLTLTSKERNKLSLAHGLDVTLETLNGWLDDIRRAFPDDKVLVGSGQKRYMGYRI